MYLLTDKYFAACIADAIDVDGRIAAEGRAEGFGVRYGAQGQAVLFDGGAGFGGVVLKLSERDAWKLDQWQDPLVTERRIVETAAFGAVYAYFALDGFPDAEQLSIPADRANAFRCMGSENQLGRADVFLTLPGKCTGFDGARFAPHKLGEELNADLISVCGGEFSGEFANSITRFSLGAITLSFVCGDREYTQGAFVNMVRHDETDICVLEIGVPACSVCVNRLLSNYTGNVLSVVSGGKKMTVAEYAASFGMELYGMKRSMVFAYDDVPEKILVNTLANEYEPMGAITGDYFKTAVRENIAQYDTARVYVSSATFVEIVRTVPEDVHGRLSYQAIEIFFIELLLMQDASMDNIYQRLLREEAIQRRKDYDTRESRKNFQQINFDMSQAMRFSDYSQFYYPTVRVSAERIAKAFGIDAIYDKYEKNKALLQYMLDVNQENDEKRDDKLKNRLLLTLTILSGINALYQVLLGLVGQFVERQSAMYYVSAIGVFAGLLVYFIIVKLRRRKKHRAKT